ncbi:LacI family DNA-binding transcriptional regulator [Pedococcus soli]
MTKPVPRRRPSLQDVAEVAGVSHQTVSRVVNGSPSVAPATRDRVLEAIHELGYRRNSAARALATRRSGTIGVVVAGLGYFGPSSTVVGLEAAARAEGYSLVLVSVSETSPEASNRATQDAIEHLIGESVEALVMIAPDDAGLDLGPGAQVPLPLVVLDSDPARAGLSVGVDHAQGARLATQHLIDLGHRHIAHIGGPANWYQAECRLEGWRSALASAGLTPGPVLTGDWTASSGYRHGVGLAADRDVSAVFVANDQMAIGVLRAMAEAGRRVPEDVSVVGFDDLPEAEYLFPPLTTVHQNFVALGRAALRELLGAINGEPGDGAVLVPPKLVVRGSTARRARA